MQLTNSLYITADGSHTIQNPHFQETYHSTNGALAESRHVFINAGFHHCPKASVIRIFEVGFGTGLNAFLTALEAQSLGQEVYYESLELYPISKQEATMLNFADLAGAGQHLFEQMHACPWEKEVRLSPTFLLHKKQVDLLSFVPAHGFHLIYFDAFSANTQPELWSEDIFRKMYDMLYSGGVLTTYASKGVVKQALRTAGFTLQRLPGAQGKRHMLRAIKPVLVAGAAGLS